MEKSEQTLTKHHEVERDGSCAHMDILDAMKEHATDFLDFSFTWERGIDGLWRNRKDKKGITTQDLYELFNKNNKQ